MEKVSAPSALKCRQIEMSGQSERGTGQQGAGKEAERRKERE